MREALEEPSFKFKRDLNPLQAPALNLRWRFTSPPHTLQALL